VKRRKKQEVMEIIDNTHIEGETLIKEQPDM
jgi:hypothetical protein